METNNTSKFKEIVFENYSFDDSDALLNHWKKLNDDQKFDFFLMFLSNHESITNTDDFIDLINLLLDEPFLNSIFDDNLNNLSETLYTIRRDLREKKLPDEKRILSFLTLLTGIYFAKKEQLEEKQKQIFLGYINFLIDEGKEIGAGELLSFCTSYSSENDDQEHHNLLKQFLALTKYDQLIGKLNEIKQCSDYKELFPIATNLVIEHFTDIEEIFKAFKKTNVCSLDFDQLKLLCEALSYYEVDKVLKSEKQDYFWKALFIMGHAINWQIKNCKNETNFKEQELKLKEIEEGLQRLEKGCENYQLLHKGYEINGKIFKIFDDDLYEQNKERLLNTIKEIKEQISAIKDDISLIKKNMPTTDFEQENFFDQRNLYSLIKLNEIKKYLDELDFHFEKMNKFFSKFSFEKTKIDWGKGPSIYSSRHNEASFSNMELQTLTQMKKDFDNSLKEQNKDKILQSAEHYLTTISEFSPSFEPEMVEEALTTIGICLSMESNFQGRIQEIQNKIDALQTIMDHPTKQIFTKQSSM